MRSITLKGAFRRKGTSEAFIPVYRGSSHDAENIRDDFRRVGSDMRSAMNEAKIKWYGKEG